jgi:RNA polymerase-binding transcription factor DksA
MTNLDADELRELRAALERREAQLVAELREGKRRAANEPFGRVASEVPDSGDASVADAAVDAVSAERERDANELRDVRDALGRMDAGVYGVCEECGEPIPLERLRAFPTARYDVAHQRNLERGVVRTPSL